MLSNTELIYVMALQRVPGLGDRMAKKLINLLGSAEAVFKEKKTILSKIDGLGPKRLKELSDNQQLDLAERELNYVKKNGLQIRYFKDSFYPDRLQQCIDGPILYFERGNIDLKHKKIISVVGTRNSTSYGRAFCESLVEQLAPLSPVIVSGFAYGIDITAHKAALANRVQTIACLAHGLNRMYPPGHIKYAAEVEENGGFISEFWSDDPFDKNNFLKRNRIIAGLSEATIVIESAEKGGSLVTADIANSYDREVLALPGRYNDPVSIGCNNLIKSQRAHAITSAADVPYLLGWDVSEKAVKNTQTRLFEELDPEELMICEFLRVEGKEHIDSIALRFKKPTQKIASLLFQLEMKGCIRPLPGKLFELT